MRRGKSCDSAGAKRSSDRLRLETTTEMKHRSRKTHHHPEFTADWKKKRFCDETAGWSEASAHFIRKKRRIIRLKLMSHSDWPYRQKPGWKSLCLWRRAGVTHSGVTAAPVISDWITVLLQTPRHSFHHHEIRLQRNPLCNEATTIAFTPSHTLNKITPQSLRHDFSMKNVPCLLSRPLLVEK